MMKYLISDLYSDYECIGGECPETCCGGWTIIVDESSYEKYCNLEEPDKSWVMNKIQKEDDSYQMILDEETKMCQFLNQEGWCLLYRNISPDMLCNTCKNFPRKAHIYYDLYALTASIACPVVARNIINMRDKIQFRYMEDEESVDIVNPNWERYNEAINGFVNTVDILQDRRLSISSRLIIALEVAKEIQNCTDQNNYNGLRDRIADYCNPEKRLEIADELDKKPSYITNIDAFIRRIFELISRGKKKTYLLNKIYCPNITSSTEFYELKDKFNSEFRNDIEYENIAVQLVFEDYMRVINGEKIYNQFLKITIYILILMTEEMYKYMKGELNEECRVLLVSRLSRIMDHSNMFNVIKDDILNKNSKDIIYDLILSMR